MVWASGLGDCRLFRFRVLGLQVGCLRPIRNHADAQEGVVKHRAISS